MGRREKAGIRNDDDVKDLLRKSGLRLKIMRVLIDLYSSLASLTVKEHYQAYIKAVASHIDCLIRSTDHRVQTISMIQVLAAIALTVLEVVSTPAIKVSDEELIRDTSDRPILRAYCGKS